MRDELLAAVIAEPDDDRPRLVFADWLLQQPSDEDRAHGELIQVQCALARLDSSGPDRARLVRRAAQLLHQHRTALVTSVLGAAHLDPRSERALFRRGFLSAWREWYGELPDALTSGAPLDELGFIVDAGDEPDGAWGGIDQAPLERVSSLALKLSVDDYYDNPDFDRARERLMALLESPRLGKLARIELSGFRLDLSQLRRVLSSSVAPRLRALRLDEPMLDDAALEALATAPQLELLETLIVDSSRATTAGLRQLERFGQLRHLALRTDPTARAPAVEDSARLLAQLPHLVGLSMNAPLASALGLDGIARLKALTIAPWAGVGVAVRRLASALPRLERLDLSYNNLDLADVRALANGPRLRELVLRSCRIGDAAAGALCDGAGLDEVELLDLTGNTIGTAARARLDARFGHGVWTDAWRT